MALAWLVGNSQVETCLAQDSSAQVESSEITPKVESAERKGDGGTQPPAKAESAVDNSQNDFPATVTASQTAASQTAAEVTAVPQNTPAATTAEDEPIESNFKPVELPSSNDLFPTYMLLGVLLIALAVASIVGQYLRRQPSESMNPALIRRFRQRVNAWWLMSAILAFSLAVHATGAVVLFLLTSFWALREFITMAPTRRGDHRALFWALIIFTPLQYILIGIERLFPSWDTYGLYSIMIPVYATIFVPARIALSGDAKRFLERSAQITSGLLICVYALSHAPALLNLRLITSDGARWTGSTAGLLCFFVLLTQLSEILQWTWSQIVGRRMIAEEISTSRTWEGFLGGTLSLGVVGSVLWWVTPFTIWEAACMSMVIGVMGMFGGMTMSAIKRDRGVHDYGSLVLGHAGVLDRIDTLCFSAPIFYHLTRYFYT